MLSNANVISFLAFAICLLTTAAWARAAYRVAIPSNRTAFLLSWGVSAAIGIASFYTEGSNSTSHTLGTLAALVSLTLLVLYSLGGQNAEKPIAVGDQIPQFSTVDSDGEPFNSASLAGTPTLLKFFRGHW